MSLACSTNLRGSQTEAMHWMLKVFFAGLMAWSFGAGETLHLTLREAVRVSLEKNPDLQKQAFDVLSSEQDVNTAALRPNPQLNVNGDILALGLHNDPPGPPLQPGNKQYGASLSYPIETGGKRGERIESAKEQQAVSRGGLKEAQREMASTVANAWLDVLEAQLTLELNQKAKALLDSTVTVNQVRLRNQVITPTELSRSIVAARQYSIDVNEAQLQVAQAGRTLALLLGMGDSDQVEIDTQDTLDWSSDVIDSAVAQVENRSDLSLARAALEASKANYDLQQSLAQPDIDVSADFTEQQSVPFYGLSLNIGLPLFDRNQGEINKARIEEQQSEFALEEQKKVVGVEVRSALEEYRVHKNSRELAWLNLQDSEKILQTVEYSYRSGNTTILDFMDAQRTWYDAQQSYNDALLAFERSGAKVMCSLGLSP